MEGRRGRQEWVEGGEGREEVNLLIASLTALAVLTGSSGDKMFFDPAFLLDHQLISFFSFCFKRVIWFSKQKGRGKVKRTRD